MSHATVKWQNGEIFEIFSKKKKIELLWSLASIQRVSSLRV